MSDRRKDAVDTSIVSLSRDHAGQIASIINRAAEIYRNVIPRACYTDPYTSEDAVIEAMGRMRFHGYEIDSLVGVIGLQPLEEVFLIRHLYVLPSRQRDGIGSSLLRYGLRQSSRDEILVGTWVDAGWAIDFYEKNGFENLGTDPERLDRYWDIPGEQRDASVVLRYTGDEP